MKLTKSTQLRGQKLLDRIKVCILEMAEAVSKTGQPFELNWTRLSEVVPCTRQTLYRHDSYIEAVVDEIGSKLRRRDGRASVEALRDKIAKLNEKLDEKDMQISALLEFHTGVFDQIMLHSVEVASLIKCDAFSKREHCVFCGASKPSVDSRSKNIVEFSGRKTTIE